MRVSDMRVIAFVLYVWWINIHTNKSRFFGIHS